MSTKRPGRSCAGWRQTSKCSLIGNPRLLLTLFLLGPTASLSGQWVDIPQGPFPDDQKIVLRQLLADSWDEAEIELQPGLAPADHSNVLVARALHHLNHRQTDEAVQVVQRLVDQHPEHIDGRLMLVWLRALTDRYETAALELRSLHRALSRPGVPPSVAAQGFQRMGKLYQYLAGPVADRVNPAILQAVEAEVEAGMPAALKQAWDQGRQQTDDQYQQILAEQQGRTADELAKATLDHQQQTDQAQQDLQRSEENLSRIEPQREALAGEADRRLDGLQEQVDVVWEQAQQVNAQLYDDEQDLGYLLTELDYELQQPPRFRTNLYWLNQQIRLAGFRLRQRRSEAFQLANQLSMLRAQQAGVRADYQGRLNRLDRQLSDEQRRQRQARGRLQRLTRGPQVADGKKSAMDHRRRALKTYDDLAVDLYRRQLLEAIQ